MDDVAVTIQEVQADNTLVARTDITQSDVVTTAGNGNIVLQTLDGDITLNDGTAATDNTAVSAHGTGNILIEALAGATDITANADILSGSGHITVVAGHDLTFTATADVITSGAATLNLVAHTGSLTQDDNSRFVTTTGDIRLVAWRNIVLGGLTTAGRASLTTSAGRILDAGDEFGDEDVIAFSLRAVAGAGIGESDNPMETLVAVLAVRTGYFGIYLLETDGVIVDEVYATIQQVGGDGTTITVAEAGLSDLRSEYLNGNIVLQTLDGDIILNDGSPLGNAGSAVWASGSGNILIESLGAGHKIEINADIESVVGNISVVANGSIFLTQGVDIRTVASGTIQVVATAGAIEQHDTSRIISQFGDVRLEALTNVLLGGVTTSANVAITALLGSILDAGDVGGEDIIAVGARLFAGIGIGAQGQPLETNISVLSARATTGGISLLETSGLTIDDVPVKTYTVTPAGDSVLWTAELQSDARTTAGNGFIVIVTVDGGLTLEDGTGPDNDGAVVADGTGSITVILGGATSVLIINADVRTGSGAIVLDAPDGLVLGATADVVTTGNTIDITSAHGGLVMASGASIVSGNDDITVTVAGDVLASVIDAGTGTLELTTAGSVSDHHDDEVVNLRAGIALLRVDGDFGTLVNPLDTAFTVLDLVVGGAGGAYFNELDSLLVLNLQVLRGGLGFTAGGSVTILSLFVNAQAGNIVVAVQGDLTIHSGLVVAHDGGIRFAADTDVDHQGMLRLGEDLRFVASPRYFIEFSGEGMVVGNRFINTRVMRIAGGIRPAPSAVDATARAFATFFLPAGNRLGGGVLVFGVGATPTYTFDASFSFFFEAPAPALSYAAILQFLTFRHRDMLFVTANGLSVYSGHLATRGMILMYSCDVEWMSFYELVLRQLSRPLAD